MLLKIIKIIEETLDTKTLRFSLDKNKFEFLPGQFIMLEAKVNGKAERRAYSISSSPTEKKFIEITVKKVENGKVSNYSLAKQKSKWTVIFFYPLDFTFVCPTEIHGFNKHFDEFKKLKADVWGVSVDSVHSHRAWIEHEFKSLKFPLLADFNKEVTKEYEIDIEEAEAIEKYGLLILKLPKLDKNKEARLKVKGS